MFKKSIFLLSVLILSVSAHAQWLINVGAAYGWGRQQSLITTVNDQGTREAVKGSFGEGVELNLGVGRQFGDRFFYGVDFNYLTGKDFIENSDNPTTAREYNKITTSGSGALIGPFLKFRVNPTGVSPYLRFTPQVAFMMLNEESVRYIGDSATADFKKYEYEAGFQFAINSALGLEFQGGDMASFFIEVFNRNLVYNPSKKINTESSALKDEDVIYKESEDANNTNVVLKKSFDFSAIGFGFGIRILLDSKPVRANY